MDEANKCLVFQLSSADVDQLHIRDEEKVVYACGILYLNSAVFESIRTCFIFFITVAAVVCQCLPANVRLNNAEP